MMSLKRIPIALRWWSRVIAILVLCFAVSRFSTAQGIQNPVRYQPLPDHVVQSHSIPQLSSEALDRIEATIEQRRAEKMNLTSTDRKVHPMLRSLDKAAGPSVAILQYDDTGRVLVMVHLGGAASLAAAEQGGLVVNRYDAADKYALGAIAPSNIRAVASVEGVSRIQPLVKSGVVHSGSVVSEGDAALNASALRSTLGADGSGVRVGVISNGTGGLAASQASGDLPSTVAECPISDKEGGTVVNNNGAEGTAMLEIIHDLAPGAELLFCPAFGPQGKDGLAASITSLANDLNADVIVDDVAFLTEPYWEDGVVAQSVDQVVANGVSYFSSAGNSAQQHYEAGYVDTVPGDQTLFPDNAHDFGVAAGGASNIFMNGLVGGTAFSSNFFAAFLQWTDPFGGSGNDYDLYLFDRNGNAAGDPSGIFPTGGQGIALQDGDDDPLEAAFVVNETPNVEDVLLVVDRFSGNEDRELEINFNGTLSILTFNEPSGSVWGHAAAAGAQALAAIDVNDPGLDDIEPFSSRGPSRIFFPNVETRAKPDIAAVDGVSVTGNGGFPSTFFGTSASAPHAAAIAGLLLDLEPTLTPSEIRDVLANTALDRGAAGIDPVFGAGLIDALAAGQSILAQFGETPVCTFRDAMGDPISGTITAQVGTSVDFTVEGTDPDGDDVTITGVNVPGWGTMSPSLPVSGNPPVSSTFSGAPTSSDVGTQAATYLIADATGAEVQCALTIDVVPPPSCDTPTLAGPDQVDASARTVSNTILDSDGIQSFTFSVLNNFPVVTIADPGFTNTSGSTWDWTESGAPPTSVDFMLTAGPSGEASYFLEATDACSLGSITTDFDPIFDLGVVAKTFGLSPAYPNPFGGQTTVEYALTERADVRLSVYDVMGRRVAMLAEGARPSGVHSVTWDGTSDGGQQLASGLYLIRLVADGQMATSRITLVR
jgi:hypothetical protein